MQRRISRMAVIGVVFATAIGLWGGQAFAMPVAQEGAPAVTIPFSGQLAGPGGAPVANGRYDLRLAFYMEPAEGELLWSKEFAGVLVENGRFSVPIEASIPLDKSWLALSVRGPGEGEFTALEPRVPFDSATAPVSAAAVDALSCDHTHILEAWIGTSTSYAFYLANTGQGDGLRVYSAASIPTDAAVYAAVSGLGPGTGVYASSTAGNGVFAKSATGVALAAESSTNDGIAGKTGGAVKSGVYGYNSLNGYGVFGRSVGGFGLGAVGAGDASGSDNKGDLVLGGSRGEIFGAEYLNLYSNGNASINLDQDNNVANACLYLFDSADAVKASFCENGTKSAVLQTEDYGQRKVYAMESPEVWLEDFGTATLANGVAIVPLDPVFAQTISQSEPYHLFVTPLGESGVLYVAEKTSGSFTVREAGGGTSNVAFDWRLAAKRAGLEGLRSEVVSTNAGELK